MPPTIRDADAPRDAQACADIYGHYVSHSVATFEFDPPSAAEMVIRITSSHVWLIAESEGTTVGYAYSSKHRDRAAYSWAADVAVYIDAEHLGAGIGRALYAELIQRMRAAGFRALCAGVTQPNAASNGLHRAMGFSDVGIYPRIGFKDGAWHDVLWLQLDLRPGDLSPPGPVPSD